MNFAAGSNAEFPMQFMKKNIKRLAEISDKQERLVIGLMSGTSMDGLDVALCRFSGAGFQTQVQVSAFDSVPYDDAFKSDLRKVFAQRTVDFQWLVLLNVMVAEKHAAIVNDCLKKWNIDAAAVDLIASHGQTVFHAPRRLHGMPDYPNATLQIGDGDHIARRTGIITVSDFRQKHVAAGGEGAPLALYGDYLLFSKPGEERFLLNMGGISNFTWLPGSIHADRVFATDTGPGNTLIDACMRRHFNQPFDYDGRTARSGNINSALLTALRTDPFFDQPFPKSTGPELFSMSWVEQRSGDTASSISPEDLVATLTELTALSIAEGLLRVAAGKQASLYVSGGGAHNPVIMDSLRKHLQGWQINPVEILGVSGDAKEAVLFALLANETIAGETAAGVTPGGVPFVGMGKISFPD